nr:tripeptidyl-peptidase sed4 [Quercus suber]
MLFEQLSVSCAQDMLLPHGQALSRRKALLSKSMHITSDEPSPLLPNCIPVQQDEGSQQRASGGIGTANSWTRSRISDCSSIWMEQVCAESVRQYYHNSAYCAVCFLIYAVETQAVLIRAHRQYQNLDQLEIELAKVSTPGSSAYGQYLDISEQNAKFAPSKASESKVVTWLKQSGATEIASDGSIVSFSSTVGNANSMLDTNFALYTNGATSKLRTTAYSIPHNLVNVVDFITPTTYFGSTKAQRVTPSLPGTKTSKAVPPTKRQLSTSCETTIIYHNSANRTREFTLLSPQCLKELYNIGDYKVDVSAGSTIAFGSFLGQSASYSDLAIFEQTFGIPSQNFTVLKLINGGVDDQDPATSQNGEANLDVQNIIGLVDGLPVGEYITGGLAPFTPDLLEPNVTLESNEPYLQYYQYLLSQPNSNLPYVISNSYGDHENTVPEKYAKRVCNMIGMMGLRGRTILESSGDEGVGAVCLANDGSNAPQFTPQFPGGFSNYFPTAWYQKKAVGTYLNNHISAATKQYYSSNHYTNFAGRGFPDISAHSLYPEYVSTNTSCSQYLR